MDSRTNLDGRTKISHPTGDALRAAEFHSCHEKWLRMAADEIRAEGHLGWGNTCEQAADAIASLTAACREKDELLRRIDEWFAAYMHDRHNHDEAAWILARVRELQPSAGSDADEASAPLNVCVYTHEPDDTLTFETGCGEQFRLDAMLELYDFCPYCGKPIEQRESEGEPATPPTGSDAS